MPVYALTSDIAQFCLPAASRDANRKYAYACSIYLAFLTIGLVGIWRAPVLIVRELPPPQEVIPIEIPPTEYQPPVQATTEPEVMDRSQDAPTDAPPMPVLVAPADANVPFAVPTEGYVAITKVVARAAAPPAIVPRPPPPVEAPKPTPTVFRRTGKGPSGRFPEPPFPQGLLRSGQEVELMLRVEVGADGLPATVEVETSSGLFELDRKVLQHVKSRWKWDPGQANLWLVPFAFQCK